jgi:methylated-DNA-[protein]-cysteine S-methyltransferase
VITFRRVPTPLGEVTVVADDDWLTELHLPGDRGVVPDDATEGGPTVDRAAQQLGEWFAGEREHFDLPLAPAGTAFQRRVWAALVGVPYGETASYGDIAAAIGQPTATRAVGAANGRNPIPLIIPCHRIIGTDGSLTGYSGGGGIETKRYLLDFERGVLTLEV